MPNNAEIAEQFDKLANLLEIDGANPFRVRAYRNAARIISNLSKNITDLVAQGEDLTELPGIGKDLADKIITLVRTGSLPLLTEVTSKTPSILNELMKIEGLGPKRVQFLYKELGIKSIHDLKNAIEKGKLKKLKGWGEKTEQKIRQGIAHLDQYVKRFTLDYAFPVVIALTQYMQTLSATLQIECAGSFRRRKETVGDLDILIASKQADRVISHFIQYPEVADILSQGSTRAAVHLRSGLQIDLRVVPKESYGAALLYFTGSKEHNILLRKMSIEKKLKLNEYGMYKQNKQIAGRTEIEIYKQLGLPYIQPELREDRGEIKAAQQHNLPTLITPGQIRGDLRCYAHTSGNQSNMLEMAMAAQDNGYEYLAISCSHLDKKTLFAHIKAIDKINAILTKCLILKAVDVPILENGQLGLPPDVLKEFDLTLCSIDSSFDLPAQQQTERLMHAMDNRFCNILIHPTGRIINERQPYAIQMETLLEAASKRHCLLELDAQPNRLDLNDIHCKMAKEAGVHIAISSAANHPSQLTNIEFGLFQARRGWLEKGDVANTRHLKELKSLLQR